MSKPSKPKLSQQSQHYGRLGHDVQRPRRPDPDDVIYLQGLPLSSTSGDEASLAARAALLSLSQSLASLCGDERGSEIIEKCIRIGIVSNEDEEEQLEVLEALESTLSALSPYTEFISINRYGSHVLSTLFSSIPPLLSSLPDTCTAHIISIKDILKGSLLELMQHISGSHVLRSLICLLGTRPSRSEATSRGMRYSGRTPIPKPQIPYAASFSVKVDATCKSLRNSMPVNLPIVHISSAPLVLAGILEKDILPPKGKKGKQRKSPTTTSTNYPHNVSLFSTPDTFKTAFDDLTSTLVNRALRKEPGFMQFLCCHTGASPVLMCLLRSGAVTYGVKEDGDIGVSEDANEKSRTLNLTTKDFPKIIEGSPLHGMCAAILGLDNAGTSKEIVYGLGGEVCGSWVLEAVMEVGGDGIFECIYRGVDGRVAEFVTDDVANFVIQSLMSHVRKPETATALIKETLPLIKSSRILKPDRSGVLMRAFQMSGRFSVSQELIYNALFAETTVSELIDCIIEERVTINVNGARTILYMLKMFEKVWAEKVFKMVRDFLNPGQIVELCKDGMGSKLLIDGMLEMPHEDLRKIATEMVMDAIKPSLLDVACDRVGHWSIEKCFGNVDLEGKMEIAMELASGQRRLEGGKVGQGVLERMCVGAFLEGKTEFEEAVKKMQRKKEAGGKEEVVQGFLDEVVKGDGDGGDGKKKKRKRKKRAAGEDKGEDMVMAKVAKS
ncbi:hypothetical protein TL16_g05687 [Triparma laevis f. inornata]|uniref:Uncharacterized protein n=1 Tax=Triparma laevis f. inornata TaxID=1714386 RepID=A0A9W7E7T4_9STRA|nr:hypothetical protein TL16_g05687 [Triparma laevis f. inornata]